ncbi:hypothetical protein [Ammoniphilus resinae]|uniref:Flagellar hook-length control protein-like C-terminal domain-containing protein n=1 Tax=Ammoniphilus resinae TaxID=861532 RepID=A0ABS4GKL5_9BACL|nr:hypothetical protein [Ammoniphilus resinae]MBP1930769.1 hypothetical protein [Ammoniphilus resinae]
MVTGTLLQNLIRSLPVYSGPKLEFTAGQIVKGTVLRNLPNSQSLLSVDGRQIIGKMEVNLNAGERVWLQVQSTGQPVMLQVIKQFDKQTGKPRAVGGRINDLASALGFEDEESKGLLSKLVSEQIPVPQSMLNNIFAINKTGERDLSDAIVLSLKRGYPVTEETVKSVDQFVSGPHLGELLALWEKEYRSIDGDKWSFPWGDKVLSLLARLRQGSPASAEMLRDFLLDLGLGWEKRLVGSNDIDAYVEQLKPLLLQIRGNLADTPSLSPLAEVTDQVIRYITGQQLFLTPGQFPLQQLLLSIPLFESSFVQIESRRDPLGQVDPNHCRLLFFLQLAKMGELLIDVQIRERMVSVDFTGEDPSLQPLIEFFRNDLSKALKETGYQLLSARVRKVGVSKGVEAKGFLQPYKGVDFRI